MRLTSNGNLLNVSENNNVGIDGSMAKFTLCFIPEWQ